MSLDKLPFTVYKRKHILSPVPNEILNLSIRKFFIAKCLIGSRVKLFFKSGAGGTSQLNGVWWQEYGRSYHATMKGGEGTEQSIRIHGVAQEQVAPANWMESDGIEYAFSVKALRAMWLYEAAYSGLTFRTSFFFGCKYKGRVT